MGWGFQEDRHTHVYIGREVYFKELGHTIVGLLSMKFVGQAGSLETQERVDVSVLDLNSTGQQA